MLPAKKQTHAGLRRDCGHGRRPAIGRIAGRRHRRPDQGRLRRQRAGAARAGRLDVSKNEIGSGQNRGRPHMANREWLEPGASSSLLRRGEFVFAPFGISAVVRARHVGTSGRGTAPGALGCSFVCPRFLPLPRHLSRRSPFAVRRVRRATTTSGQWCAGRRRAPFSGEVP